LRDAGFELHEAPAQPAALGLGIKVLTGGADNEAVRKIH
jgi:hypothetical protein